MKRAKHTKQGFKRFGKGPLMGMWCYAKRAASINNQMAIASRNIVDNGDGTISFHRPKAWRE